MRFFAAWVLVLGTTFSLAAVSAEKSDLQSFRENFARNLIPLAEDLLEPLNAEDLLQTFRDLQQSAQARACLPSPKPSALEQCRELTTAVISAWTGAAVLYPAPRSKQNLPEVKLAELVRNQPEPMRQRATDLVITWKHLAKTAARLQVESAMAILEQTANSCHGQDKLRRMACFNTKMFGEAASRLQRSADLLRAQLLQELDAAYHAFEKTAFEPSTQSGDSGDPI